MRLKKVYSDVALGLLLPMLILFSSCENDDEKIVTGSVTYYGAVKVEPETAKNNDVISLSIGAWNIETDNIGVSISSNYTINGKNIIKSISYYIDDNFIVESSDVDNNYSATYKVSGLEIGEHKVAAHCNSNFKDFKIDEHITVGKLQIE